MKKNNNNEPKFKVDHVTINKVQTAYETDRYLERELNSKCPAGYRLVGMVGEAKEDERKAFSGTVFLAFEKI